MGCVQAKPSLNSPTRGGSGSLDKMKLANGYVPARRSTGGSTRYSRPNSRERPMQRVRSRQTLSETSGSSRDQREAVEQETKVAPLPPTVPIPAVVPPAALARARRDLEEEEMVDGWPKWLTDNIPREVLAGLEPKSADSYDKLAKVGQGTYSNVYKARDRDTGKIVALKKVRFDTSETESVKFMAREIMILQKLDHPNIIKLEGLATSRMQYSLYLVFDFMQTDLSKVISRPEGRLTEPQVKCYMNQLLSGLQHCHERGILHRDIKGSNLLIDKYGMLKIGDFGLANYFDPKKKRPLTSRVVTLWYRAPELLLGTTDYGVGIDLWSAGCLLAEMFAGRPIMPGRTEVEQLHRIFKLCGSPSEDYWRKLRISTSFRPPQPYKPTIVETFRDFPSSSLGLLKALLALDPALRGSAASALQNEFFTTSPFACDLSGLPVGYKPDEDEAILPRRKRRSSRLKQRSRTQKEGQRNVDDMLIPKGDSVFTKEERTRVRATHSSEMGSSTTGSTSSGAPSKKYYLKSPSVSSVGSLPENAGRQRIHSNELGSNITTGSVGQAYSYYVSSPPSLSPVSSPLLQKTGSQVKPSHELNIITTGSPSSGEHSKRYTVSPPTSPSPVKSFDGHDQITTEGHPSATKNIKNKPPHYAANANPNRANNLRYGMEKRSVSTTGYRRTDKKQIPKRYAVG